MSVTVDVSAAVNGKAGIGRYAAMLVAALAAEHAGEVNLFANITGEPLRSSLPSHLTPTRSIRLGYKPWRMAVWLGQLIGVGFDGLLGKTSLYHSTEHLLMPLRRIPSVLTVHDLIYRLFPQYHKRLNYWYLNAAMPLFVRRASHIITISQCSKDDLIQVYGTPPEKISVIYEAAAPHFKPQEPKRIAEVVARYRLPERYLVTVGTIEPRKNLARLVEALSILRRDDPALALVVVGSKGWLYQGFYQAIEQFGQQQAVILPGYVPDEDLPAVYAGSAAAVSASLYEGFGLPVLEAMASGAPVACSATSSLGEIGGDAAMTFDPENAEIMAWVLRRLLTDVALREALKKKGFARAAEFSWKRAAQETWEVYQKVLADGRGLRL